MLRGNNLKSTGALKSVSAAVAFSSIFAASSAKADEVIEPPEPLSALKPASPNGGKQPTSVRALNRRAVVPYSGKITFEWRVNSKYVNNCFAGIEGGMIEQGGYLQKDTTKEEKASHGAFASVLAGCKFLPTRNIAISAYVQMIGSQVEDRFGRSFVWNSVPHLTLAVGKPTDHPHKLLEFMSARITSDFDSLYVNVLFAGIKELGHHSHLLYTALPFYSRIAEQDVFGATAAAIFWKSIGHWSVGAGVEESTSVNLQHSAVILEGGAKFCASRSMKALAIGACAFGGYAGVVEFGSYHPDKEPNSPLARFSALFKY